MQGSRFESRNWARAAVLAAGMVLAAAADHAVAAPPATDAKPPSAPLAAQVPVDLNAASEAQLTAIPGIGPALARRIIEHREQNGPFRRVEDVLLVRGIGEKSFQKIQSYLKVEPRK